jgi:two-component system, NtrC family, response regulator HydG
MQPDKAAMIRHDAKRASGHVLVVDDQAASRAVVEQLVRGDWLKQPVDQAALGAAIRRALAGGPTGTGSEQPDADPFAALVGRSQPFGRVIELARRAAASRAAVLVTGETGTGKGLLARAMHLASPRSFRPFVTVNAGSLVDTLLESELFGHERGAFTGAHERRRGRFEQADGGTLFLDEIGEIPASTQVKLLGVLQDHSFERVGGNARITVDVRLIAATHRDLDQEIAASRFRRDLLYRLKVLQIEIPPLRERGDDVMLLADALLSVLSVTNGKDVRGFSDAARRRLRGHAWPGNVRELENAIEQAVVLCDGSLIEPEHLPLQASLSPPPRLDAAQKLADLERSAILAALRAANGSTARAAELLGISVRTVQYRVKQYGLARARGQTGPRKLHEP